MGRIFNTHVVTPKGPCKRQKLFLDGDKSLQQRLRKDLFFHPSKSPHTMELVSSQKDWASQNSTIFVLKLWKKLLINVSEEKPQSLLCNPEPKNLNSKFSKLCLVKRRKSMTCHLAPKIISHLPQPRIITEITEELILVFSLQNCCLVRIFPG